MTREAIQVGYFGRAYARSLSEFGEPLDLPRSGGGLLKRAIPGSDRYDAMGCYPLFCCDDWTALPRDLASLEGGLVSVGLVADPFGAPPLETLQEYFDVARPFKRHFIVELDRPLAEIGTKHHRKAALAARRKTRVERCLDPAGFVEEWTQLHQTLVARHRVRGLRAFSKQAFQRQLALPGVDVLVAYQGDELVGAQIYFLQDGVAQCHLGAVNDTGYDVGAFYALDHYSYEYFAGRAEAVDLGGGLGVEVAPEDGLSRYKNGWATTTRPVCFCGKILDAEAYAELARGRAATDYFPAYRVGEFD